MKKLALFAALALLVTPAFAQVTNGKVTTAAPTYTNNTISPLSLDTLGRLRVLAGGPVMPDGSLQATPITIRANGADDISNSGILGRMQDVSGNFAFFGSVPYLFDGVTWDRTPGNSLGTFVQGNVAPGAADTANPVKVGGIYLATLATSPDGSRTNAQSDAYGNLRTLITGQQVTGIDTIQNNNLVSTQANSSAGNGNARPLIVAPYSFGGTNGTVWERNFICANSAVINVASGVTGELVTLQSGQQIRVCSFVVSADTLAATATFNYGTGAGCTTGRVSLTGAMRLQDEGNISASAGQNDLFRSPASQSLCLSASGGAITGFVSYTQF